MFLVCKQFVWQLMVGCGLLLVLSQWFVEVLKDFCIVFSSCEDPSFFFGLHQRKPKGFLWNLRFSESCFGGRGKIAFRNTLNKLEVYIIKLKMVIKLIFFLLTLQDIHDCSYFGFALASVLLCTMSNNLIFFLFEITACFIMSYSGSGESHLVNVLYWLDTDWLCILV